IRICIRRFIMLYSVVLSRGTEKENVRIQRLTSILQPSRKCSTSSLTNPSYSGSLVAVSSQSLQNIRRRGISSQRRADLRSLNLATYSNQHLTGDCHTLRASGVSVRSRRHASEDRVRHRHPQLVLHEFRIADAHERPDTGEYGNAELLNPPQKCL